MTPTITIEQVLSLAPDPAVARAGRELALPRRWADLACDAQALWGACQGSGASPYQTQVDLSGPAIKCSCPSHKRPCKHGLGLLLLFAAQPEAFKAAPQPEWVSEWLAGRTERAQQQAEKRAQRTGAVADPKAQAKRSAKRQARILAGLDELDLWLGDLARRGLAGLQSENGGAWEQLAARMVDAQAPGLARQLREIAALPVAGANWHERIAERLGKLNLIIEGYRRLDDLPSGTQADLRALVGWPVGTDDLKAEPSLHGEWMVLSQRVTQEDRLRVQRTWLWAAHASGRTGASSRTHASGRGDASGGADTNGGADSPPAALLLDFAAGGQPFETGLLPGTQISAELVFYPSAYPLRASLRERQPSAPASPWIGYRNLDAAAGAFAAALARYPWLERFPVPLQSVLPQRVGNQWWLRDTAGLGWPLNPEFELAWELLALSGGQPLPVFGEWDGRSLWPLSAWADGRLVPLSKAEA